MAWSERLFSEGMTHVGQNDGKEPVVEIEYARWRKRCLEVQRSESLTKLPGIDSDLDER